MSWQARHSEAISHFRRATELDPLNLMYNTNLGQGFENARQYEASLEQLKKALDMDPNFGGERLHSPHALPRVGQNVRSASDWYQFW